MHCMHDSIYDQIKQSSIMHEESKYTTEIAIISKIAEQFHFHSDQYLINIVD